MTMTVESYTIRLQTCKEGENPRYYRKVQRLVSGGKVTNGIAFVFVPQGATVALTTMEYEAGVATDLLDMLEANWLQEPVPTLMKNAGEKKLALGIWQQIVFVELDVRPRDRTVLLQLIGE